MKAHRTDGVSFTFGLVFLAIVAWWLVAQLLDLALPTVGWIVAGGLILIGVLGLLGALSSGRNATPPPSPAATSAPARPSPAGAGAEAGSYEPTSGAPYEPTSGAPAAPPAPARGDDQG